MSLTDVTGLTDDDDDDDDDIKPCAVTSLLLKIMTSVYLFSS